MNSKKFNRYSEYLLLSKNLIEKKDSRIINRFAFIINMFIYNIVTLSCIITLINNNNSVFTINNLNHTKNYLDKEFKVSSKIKGGNPVLSPSYFGKNEDQHYSENNVMNDIEVNFEAGILRPQLGGSNGGCNNCSFNKLLMISAGKIYKEHKVKVSKDLKQIVVNIVKNNLYKMVYLLKMKSKNNKLSVNKINLYLNKSVYKKLIN
jgi:hypothetical protein